MATAWRGGRQAGAALRVGAPQPGARGGDGRTKASRLWTGAAAAEWAGLPEDPEDGLPLGAPAPAGFLPTCLGGTSFHICRQNLSLLRPLSWSFPAVGRHGAYTGSSVGSQHLAPVESWGRNPL